MKESDFAKISAYFNNVSVKQKNSFRLNEQTITDLNIPSVFESINHTCSPLGEQFLYDSLINNCFAVQNKDRLEMDVRFFSANPHNGDVISKVFIKHSNELEFLCDFLWSEDNFPHYLFYTAVTLFLLINLSIVLTIFNPVFIASFLILVFINIAFYVLGKKNILYAYWGLKALKSFIKLSKCLNNCKLPPSINRNNFNTNVNRLKVVERYLAFVEVGTDSNDSFVVDELKSTALAILEYVKIIFLLEFFSIYRILKLIRKNFESYSTLFEDIAYVDFVLSIKTFREQNSTCIPEFTTKNSTICIEDAIHPLIENCVPNDIKLKKNSLITGPNMSGKTSLLRIIGVNVILSQAINTCLASRYSAPLQKVLTSINIKDNISKNESFYKAELLRIKDIIAQTEQTGNVSLIIIDEILKGTNTKERLSGGYAILNYLGKLNTINVVTTHEPKFGLMLKSNFSSYNFDISNKVHKNVFKLQHGSSTVTNGISLMEELGLPTQIIKEAREMNDMNN